MICNIQCATPSSRRRTRKLHAYRWNVFPQKTTTHIFFWSNIGEIRDHKETTRHEIMKCNRGELCYQSKNKSNDFNRESNFDTYGTFRKQPNVDVMLWTYRGCDNQYGCPNGYVISELGLLSSWGRNVRVYRKIEVVKARPLPLHE